MVTVDNEVWDAFLKSHNDATQFRVHSFPHFEELTIIWGKDRTTGKDAQVAEDILEEIEVEDMENQKQNLEENLNSVAGEESNEVNNEEHSHAHQPSESTSSGRKRKRSGYDANIIVDAVKELAKEFKIASEKLANTLASTDSIQEKFVEVIGALRDIDGLTREERVHAIRKFSKNSNDVLMFFGAKPEECLGWVKDFIAYD